MYDPESDAGQPPASADAVPEETSPSILARDGGPDTAIDDTAADAGAASDVADDDDIGDPADTAGRTGEAGDAQEDHDRDGENNGDGDDGNPAEGEEDEDGEDALPLVSVVEAVLFAAREPLKPVQIARAVGKRTRQEAVRAAMDELNLAYLESGRAFEIAEVSGRYQLMSRPEYARHIMRLYPKRELTQDKTPKLTPAALETLTIIAYKQPVTRGEIEHIRGVGCGQTIRTLIERGSVAKKGKREDLIGQPPTYVTTDAFLVEFGLGSLDELPMRHEIVGMFGDALPGLDSAADPENVELIEDAGAATPAVPVDGSPPVDAEPASTPMIETEPESAPVPEPEREEAASE